MKKSRGFTLVELLAVIAILGILLSISTVAVFKIRKSQDEKNEQNLIINILTKAKEYVADHPEALDTDTDTIKVSVSNLDVNFSNKQKEKYDGTSVIIEPCDSDYRIKYSLTVDEMTYNDCGCENQSSDAGDAKKICTN